MTNKIKLTEEQARNLHQFTNKMYQFFKDTKTGIIFDFETNEDSTDDGELTLILQYPELLEHLGIPIPDDQYADYFNNFITFQSYIFWTWGGLDHRWFICSQEVDELIYTKLVWRAEPQETLPDTEHYLADEC